MSHLIEPTLQYKESFVAALEEFSTQNISGFWLYGGDPTNVEEYLRRIELYKHGDGLPKHLVPASTLWLVDHDEFVGHLNIRHCLNDHLRHLGGHIGYAIRPSKQGQGYGSAMMRLALPVVKQLGIDRALVTCDPDNLASKKIIEKHGGQLQDEITYDNRRVLRYWIDV